MKTAWTCDPVPVPGGKPSLLGARETRLITGQARPLAPQKPYNLARLFVCGVAERGGRRGPPIAGGARVTRRRWCRAARRRSARSARPRSCVSSRRARSSTAPTGPQCLGHDGAAVAQHGGVRRQTATLVNWGHSTARCGLQAGCRVRPRGRGLSENRRVPGSSPVSPSTKACKAESLGRSPRSRPPGPRMSLRPDRRSSPAQPRRRGRIDGESRPSSRARVTAAPRLCASSLA